ncbi:MAG TPA: heme biosynthesis protein HemY [Ectothiorhodospiraceae bacterium]|nr:heme biosynthesis protein HemY [Ectothiorhodospiraceae bacterium]
MLFYRTLAILTAIAVAIIWIAQYDAGYLFINYRDWQLETSLTFALIIIAILFSLFYLAIRTLSGTLKLPLHLAHWQQRRRAERIRHATHQGLIALTEGRWKQAERYLGRYASGSEAPLLNYLGAARAAQKLGSSTRRDRYLAAAARSMPDAELAVGLTQAEVQLSNKQTEQALATLRHLHTIAPKHEHVLYLLKRIYLQLKSWDDLMELLPELRQQKVFETEVLDALEKQIHQNRLQAAAERVDSLHQCWSTIPEKVRQQPQFIHLYASQLKNLGAEHEAEVLLRDALKANWDPELVRLYGRIAGEDLMVQLNQLELWLGEYGKHPELLLALGRVSMRNQLWGKAQAYLEASNGIEPRAETYCELGKLLHNLEEFEKANECFHSGLELSVGGECIQAYDGTITHNPFAAHPTRLEPSDHISDHLDEGAASKASE